MQTIAAGAKNDRVHDRDVRAIDLDRLVKRARLAAARDSRAVEAATVSGDSNVATRVAVEGAEEAVSDAPVVAYAAAAMGVVESVVLDVDSKAVTILGQTFVGVSGEALVSVGDYVVAASDDTGQLALLMPIEDSYVPGASTVWVAGTVGAVDNDIGTFSIGNTSFDYTALLVRNPALSPGVGDVVDMFGVQPVIGGRVLLSITGGDVRGITGGDARGITGGDARGITGGDARGITGGDARGITGGDARGITGGDARGITGGDARGITGGDARGITGGDARGITGGDAR
jgi:hypothetical protein